MTGTAVEKSQIELFEEHVLRLTIRCDAIEGLFSTITERIIASLDETEARKVMEELRANIMVGEARMVADGDLQRAEDIVLQTEVYATRLLDQIERSANVERIARRKR